MDTKNQSATPCSVLTAVEMPIRKSTLARNPHLGIGSKLLRIGSRLFDNFIRPPAKELTVAESGFLKGLQHDKHHSNHPT